MIPALRKNPSKTTNAFGIGRLFKALMVAVVSYLALGHIAHRYVFPEQPPDATKFPSEGHVLTSRTEGFRIALGPQVGSFRNSIRLELSPGAEGPPTHTHAGFDELFEVKEGVLQLELGDATVSVPAGQSYRVLAGTPHRPWNPGATRVVVESSEGVPQAFLACLSQLYPRQDNDSRVRGQSVLPFLAVAKDFCDTRRADLPLAMQELLFIAIAPTARLLGYRSFDESLLQNHGVDAHP